MGKAKRKATFGLAALAAVAVLAAVTSLDVPGAEAQSLPTISTLARECGDGGKWVAVGGDKIIDTQQSCRARFRISVPKSYTAENTYTLKFDWGDPVMAPEILRSDVLDKDCATPATTFNDGATHFNDDDDDGTVITPDLANWPVKILSASAAPATLAIAGPYSNDEIIDLKWNPWQAGDSDPRVWDVTVDIKHVPDGAMNRIEHGCFETKDGGSSHVFYRAAIFHEWRFRNQRAPVQWTGTLFIVKDNDNGPYSVNHPSAPRSSSRSSSPPPPAVGPPKAAQAPAPPADEALPVDASSAEGSAAEGSAAEMSEASSAGVEACILGEARSRSHWAARLVDCLELRDAAAPGRLVPTAAAAQRFDDIADDPNRDDIVLLARYGLPVGCEPGRFCGDGQVTVTERTAVLLAAIAYGLIELTLSG